MDKQLLNRKRLRVLAGAAGGALVVILVATGLWFRGDQENNNLAQIGAPIVFRTNTSVEPGDTINVIGSFNETARVFFQVITNTGQRGPEQSLSINNQSGSLIQAVLPADIDGSFLGVVKVRQTVGSVENVESNELLINAPQVNHFITEDVAPGETLDIFGRDLVPDRVSTKRFSASRVYFERDGRRYEAPVISGDWLHLTVRVPNNLPPANDYRLIISNGLGGSAGEVATTRPLSAVRAGTDDSLGLGVNWARELDFINDQSRTINVKTDGRLIVRAIGDGVANDLPALQAAIDLASQLGGGVVFVPEGTYRLDLNAGSTISLKQRVVVRGSGKEKTRLVYGSVDQPDNKRLLTFNQDADGGHAGLTSLTIENINHQNPNPALRGLPWATGIDLGTADYIFLHQVQYLMGSNDGLGSDFVSRLLIAESEFINRLALDRNVFNFRGHIPLQAVSPERQKSAGRYNLIRNSRFVYINDRFTTLGWQDSALIGNEITRDLQAKPDLQRHTGCCSGGLSFNFSNDASFIGNTVQTINGFNRHGNNDGEGIGSEQWTDYLWHRGTVTTATATTLGDASRKWDTSNRWPTYNNGKNFGQPKRIGTPGYNPSTDYNSDGIDSDIPADLPPGSRIVPWAHYQQVIVAITDGHGFGQWRRVVGHSPTELTVDRPWDVIPDKTSSYKVLVATNLGITVANNQVRGSAVGINFYDGVIDSLIANNTVIDGGEISILAKDLHGGYAHKSCDFMGHVDGPYSPLRQAGLRTELENVPAAYNDCTMQSLSWDNDLIGNRTENTTGLYVSRIFLLANNFINGSDHDDQDYVTDCNSDGRVDWADVPCSNDYKKDLPAPSHGNAILNTTLRRNTIVAHPTALMDNNYLRNIPGNAAKNADIDFASRERFYIVAGGSAQGMVQNVQAGAKHIVGTVLDDNVITNFSVSADDSAYSFSLGTAQTSLKSDQQPAQSYCYRTNLGRSDNRASSIRLIVTDPSRKNSYYKVSQPFVTESNTLVADGSGIMIERDPAHNFRLRYRYQISDRQDNGVNWSYQRWVPINTGQTYDVWQKVPGFLSRKVTNVNAAELMAPDNCQNIALRQPLLPGDFDGDDSITRADTTTLISQYRRRGSIEGNHVVYRTYNGPPTLKNVADLIRFHNNRATGDSFVP